MESTIEDLFSIADRVGADDAVKDGAVQRLLRVEPDRINKAIISACIMLASREGNLALTFKSLSEETGVKPCTIRKAMEGVGRTWTRSLPTRSFVETFANDVGLSVEDTRAASEAVEIIQTELDIRKNPTSIAAAAVYLCGDRANFADVVRASKLTAKTVEDTVKLLLLEEDRWSRKRRRAQPEAVMPDLEHDDVVLEAKKALKREGGTEQRQQAGSRLMLPKREHEDSPVINHANVQEIKRERELNHAKVQDVKREPETSTESNYRLGFLFDATKADDHADERNSFATGSTGYDLSTGFDSFSPSTASTHVERRLTAAEAKQDVVCTAKHRVGVGWKGSGRDDESEGRLMPETGKG